MSTHNICFHGEIRKKSYFLVEGSALSGARDDTSCLHYCLKMPIMFVVVGWSPSFQFPDIPKFSINYSQRNNGEWW